MSEYTAYEEGQGRIAEDILMKHGKLSSEEMPSMSQHTPTPELVHLEIGNGRIVYADGQELCRMPPTCVTAEWEEKANKIVRAVNSHEALKELVKDWRKDLVIGLEKMGDQMPEVVFQMFKQRIARIDAIAQDEKNP